MSVSELHKKRLWTVADFASFMGISQWRARTLLKRLDDELGGMLLRKSGGKKPEYTFFPALLAKAKPEVFDRLESLEGRVERLEEAHDEAVTAQRTIVAQVAVNTRDIARLRKSRAA